MTDKLNVISNELLHKNLEACSSEECYAVIKEYVARIEAAREREDKFSQLKSGKKLYYISAEFLIGKLMSNNLINLGVYEEVRAELEAAGKNLAEIEEIESEASLGNGGLGRLAACFLDSIANLGLNGDGVGLNYHLGLFRQILENGKQKEVPNPWIGKDSWLIPTDVSYKIDFADFSVTSKMYDINVYGEKTTNKLHLFDIATVDESIVKSDGIDFDKEDIKKNLTLFLYPDDSDEKGRLLRIYQQYFMVSNGARLILDECRAKCEAANAALPEGERKSYRNLSELAVIQINDTHPTMIIPELIRLLTENGDIDGTPITMDEAVAIVSSSCAYTNHTILAEALEKWPVRYLEKCVPQLMPVIRELDRRVRERYTDSSVYIIEERDDDSKGIVHMAHIDIHYGMSVNGVAKLHTEILKNTELNNFYKIYPEKFNNKTNGITFRRWLIHCNHELADYITRLIGDGYRHDAMKLKELLAYTDDMSEIDNLLEIKQHNKTAFARYIYDTQGIVINDNSIYDVQVKRLHEYKRQQMNALYVIYKYFDIKNGNIPKTPITVIFGAKAAPAYTIAKDIIHLILTLSKVIGADDDVNRYLKVVMVENYNVTLAEKLIPACDISEQISLASKEASGTGNMKFMLNGAVTLGTMDGANVEIAELVGKDNIYTFGASSDEVIAHYANSDYSARKLYEEDPVIKQCVDFIVSDTMLAAGDEVNLRRLYSEIVGKDWFMALLDLKSYIDVKEQALADYEDRRAWGKKMLINIANAGFFSSDRTIEEYNRDIFKL